MQNNIDQLRQWLSRMDSAVVAFSGGIDSTLLLKTAVDVLGERVWAVTVSSPLNNPEETELTKDLAKHIGVAHHIILEHNDLEIPEVRENHRERCYFCKKKRFELLLDFAKQRDIAIVIEGTNHDDLSDYRPGQKALQELNIASPLMEFGFSKKDIREAARFLGLPNWNKQPEPCLATRFPTNTEMTTQDIDKVLRSEIYLHQLLTDDGAYSLRVRVHGNLARIESDPACFEKIISYKKEITETLQSFGFSFVSLDLKGYQTGNMNLEVHNESGVS